MLSFIWGFNNSIFWFFTIFYAYQVVYALVGLLFSIKNFPAAKQDHRYAVLIAARNEENVIGELVKSIKEQNYPADMLDIYVIADNCTDHTAEAAKTAGAQVLERFNNELTGKGYALDYAFAYLKSMDKRKQYEGFFIFDADNLLDGNFVKEMNDVFDQGYRVVTGYRSSKNFGDNWITAGYSIWFSREASYLNKPRMILGNCCAVSGTGFLVSSDIIEENDGWKHFLLTEDLEFNASCILRGEKIAYCEKAIFYDEQPRRFGQSWNQRLRWMKGTYQVLGLYGTKLFSGIFKAKPMEKYDILMSMAPALIVTFMSVFVNFVCLCLGVFEIFTGIGVIAGTLHSFLMSLSSFYAAFFTMGALTLLTEWKKIKAPAWRKVAFSFTFPLFIFTYIPISITAMFKKVKWTPIEHSVIKSERDIY